MQWNRTDLILPDPNIVVDTISKNGEQRKLYCGMFTTNWFNANEPNEETGHPYFWKLPDPVADASQELLTACRGLERLVQSCENILDAVLTGPELTSARALLKRLEE